MYAQTRIVVVLITRHHGAGQVPGWVEMKPTDLPELFNPSRDQGNLKKPKFWRDNMFINHAQKINIFDKRSTCTDLRTCLGGYFGARNPNLRSKIVKNDLPEAKTEEKLVLQLLDHY